VRVILLPRSFDIATVRTVATEIQDALAVGELTFDATETAKVDAAGLQVLCAAMSAARTAGRRVVWKNVPAALREGARTLALDTALELPEAR
jgi:anti-anti-sigma regulatory factor